MSDYKSLKKVIAVSSVAAATLGAGAVVNADNVNQQSASSQETSVMTKASSELQSSQSENKVVLKSSSSKNATTSSAASSSSSAVTSSTKKDAQPVNLAATNTPSTASVQHDTVQNDINNVNNLIKKYQSDNSMAVSTASSNFGTSLVTGALNDYASGLATKEELQNDVQKVQDVLHDDQNALAKETNAHAKEIIQAQVKLDQDAYALLSQAVNGNASQSSSSKVSSQSSSQSSKKSTVKASSVSSKKTSSSSKNDGKGTSSVKASSQSSKKSTVKASSVSFKKTSSSLKSDSKRTSSVKLSSQASKKNEANLTSAVNTLKNDVDKYQNSSDAVTKSYAQEAQQWLSNLQTFMNGAVLSSQDELNNEINSLKNDIKTNQDTLNASWFKGSAETKKIIQDQINADKAVLAYLTGQDQGAQQSSSIQKTPGKTDKSSNNKNNSTKTGNDGVKNDNEATVKTIIKTSHQAPVLNKKTTVKVNHQAIASNKKTTVKQAMANSSKKAPMPQTGEASNAGILAGVGALAIAAVGAFLFHKRG